MLNVCNRLFSIWEECNVRYCHWKSNEHLGEGLNGKTDLDIFVYLDDKELAQEGLRKAAYVLCRTQKGSRYPLVEEWMGFDEETGKLVHVHQHYQIISGTKFSKEYIIPFDELIIKTRIKDEKYGVYVAAPEVELIILCIRVVLKARNKKKITGNSFQAEFEFLWGRCDYSLLKQYLVQLMGVDAGTRFFSEISKRNLSEFQWKVIYSQTKCFLRKNRKLSSWKVSSRYRYFLYRNKIISVLNNKFNCTFINKKTLIPQGISICFIGQDGSGKSSVSSDVCKWLNWKLAAHRFYLGSGDHYHSLIKSIIQLLAKKTKQKRLDNRTEHPINEKKQKVEAKGIKGLPRRIVRTLGAVNCCQVINNAYKEIMKSIAFIGNGGISLYDRFPQDQFPGLYDGLKSEQVVGETRNLIINIAINNEKKIMEKVLKYQPDLVFKLILPAEESIRRKDIRDVENIYRKAAITEKLQFPQSVVYSIDATQPYEDELLEIKRIIWKTILARQ